VLNVIAFVIFGAIVFCAVFLLSFVLLYLLGELREKRKKSREEKEHHG
jgi:hypothetical protein